MKAAITWKKQRKKCESVPTRLFSTFFMPSAIVFVKRGS
jgi:hypothetical protein